MRIPVCMVTVVATFIVGSAALADLDPPPEGWPPIDGVVGLETADGHGWLAVRVAIPDSCALSGILWYNNDQGVVFPTVAIATGHEDGPGSLDDATVIAEAMSGGSGSWSQCEFEVPVAALLGSLYIVLEFPAGSGYEFSGDGGGAGIGYSVQLLQPHGWISGDGEEWLGLSDAMGFAVLPEFVPYVPGMMVKSLDGPAGESTDLPEAFYGSVGPNPFNPALTIRYGLVQEGEVTITVFDIRGRRVARVVDRVMPAGHHIARWDGKDAAGRAVASGAYIVRIEAGADRIHQRATLIK